MQRGKCPLLPLCSRRRGDHEKGRGRSERGHSQIAGSGAVKQKIRIKLHTYRYIKLVHLEKNELISVIVSKSNITCL